MELQLFGGCNILSKSRFLLLISDLNSLIFQQAARVANCKDIENNSFRFPNIYSKRPSWLEEKFFIRAFLPKFETPIPNKRIRHSSDAVESNSCLAVSIISVKSSTGAENDLLLVTILKSQYLFLCYGHSLQLLFC